MRFTVDCYNGEVRPAKFYVSIEGTKPPHHQCIVYAHHLLQLVDPPYGSKVNPNTLIGMRFECATLIPVIDAYTPTKVKRL